jgi:hypothetical protein
MFQVKYNIDISFPPYPKNYPSPSEKYVYKYRKKKLKSSQANRLPYLKKTKFSPLSKEKICCRPYLGRISLL